MNYERVQRDFILRNEKDIYPFLIILFSKFVVLGFLVQLKQWNFGSVCFLGLTVFLALFSTQ